jgi:hypothetical protein
VRMLWKCCSKNGPHAGESDNWRVRPPNDLNDSSKVLDHKREDVYDFDNLFRRNSI